MADQKTAVPQIISSAVSVFGDIRVTTEVETRVKAYRRGDGLTELIIRVQGPGIPINEIIRLPDAMADLLAAQLRGEVNYD